MERHPQALLFRQCSSDASVTSTNKNSGNLRHGEDETDKKNEDEGRNGRDQHIGSYGKVVFF